MIVLCGFAVSNYYNKLKLVLLEKAIPFEERLVYPWQRARFVAASPLGKIPYLETEHGGLSESQAILEYLEDAYPQTPLYPAEAFARAKCRELIQHLEYNAEWVARRLYKECFFGGSVSQETKSEAQEKLAAGLAAITRDDLLAFHQTYYTPSTMVLAVVGDDHDMGVTHVIRGDDHINNAFRQLCIVRAMHAVEGGWHDPYYGHIPLIHGADGAKLSKRHGALGVDAYRDELGLLPEAVVNYLLRLGWGHGDEEFIAREQAVEWFDIADVNKGPARFDLKKLLNLNGHYLRLADDTRLVAEVAQRLGLGEGAQIGLLEAAMPVLKVRAADLNELAEAARFLFARRPIEPDAKAAALLTDDARALLSKTFVRLDRLTDWTSETLEAALKDLAAELGLGLGKLAQPLRAALTGQTTSPGIFDVLALVGRAEALGRIQDQLADVSPA